MVCNFTFSKLLKLDGRIQNADKAREIFDSEVSASMESIKRKLGKEYRIDNSTTVNSALHEILEDLDVALTCGGNNPNYSTSEILYTFNESVKRLNLEDKRYLQVKDVLAEEYLHLPN
jgi:hypothetical protein